jgi:hypothetical protein
MEQPIACSLDVDQAGTRLDEWRALAPAVRSADRTDPTSLVVQIDGTDDQLAALAVLARKEAECCPFFAFAIEVSARELTFRVTVPADAAAVLDEFASLLG